MTDTSKCNDYYEDGIRQFTLIWLVNDLSAPTDVLSYRLKSKCMCCQKFCIFYNLDTTEKGGTVQIFYANESEFCSGRN